MWKSWKQINNLITNLCKLSGELNLDRQFCFYFCFPRGYTFVRALLSILEMDITEILGTCLTLSLLKSCRIVWPYKIFMTNSQILWEQLSEEAITLVSPTSAVKQACKRKHCKTGMTTPPFFLSSAPRHGLWHIFFPAKGSVIYMSGFL